MKLSGELDYRIRYDVEHDLFHAQNVFSDEYITPTFVEYVQKLEKENEELKDKLEKETAHRIRNFNKAIEWKEKHRTLKKENAELKTLIKSEHEIEARKNNRLISQLTKAKELLRKLIDYPRIYGQASGRYKHECDLAEQFLKDSEVEK